MLLNLLQEFDLCHLLMLENYFAIFSDHRHPAGDVKTPASCREKSQRWVFIKSGLPQGFELST